VVATVLAHDLENDPDIVALIAASAALVVSGAPFMGPIGAARVGFIDGQYVLNPTLDQVKESRMDLVVASTDDAVMMVESEIKELNEDEVLGGVMFAFEANKQVIQAIIELAEHSAKEPFEFAVDDTDAVKAEAKKLIGADLAAAFKIVAKGERHNAVEAAREKALAKLGKSDANPKGIDANKFGDVFKELEADVVRRNILDTGIRIDGRTVDKVRPIVCEVGVLPRAHGSALFTRGETQALVVTTLGTGDDEQLIDALEGKYYEKFMLHYNFPPFSVGETGMMGSPKRREIGHGNLARRGVRAVMPDMATFPYVIRIVSEILESNGSSSMASVCGSSLALMDAGVPIKAPVAGVAMGLVLEGGKFQVLTDILGDEDHLGDMDFKVAGTQEGVTALQMDIKVEGVTPQIMRVALTQAREGRLHILGEMAKVLSSSRAQMSEWAPSIITLRIDPEKIRDVIGKGGAVIRQITEETGTTIDIENDGTVKIASVDGAAGREAQRRIELITADVEVGRIYEGRVVKLMDFGAFVTILPGRDGLVHISQISEERVERVSDKLKEGDVIRVKVLEVDRQGRVRLSMRNVDAA